MVDPREKKILDAICGSRSNEYTRRTGRSAFIVEAEISVNDQGKIFLPATQHICVESITDETSMTWWLREKKEAN